VTSRINSILVTTTLVDVKVNVFLRKYSSPVSVGADLYISKWKFLAQRHCNFRKKSVKNRWVTFYRVLTQIILKSKLNWHIVIWKVDESRVEHFKDDLTARRKSLGLLFILKFNIQSRSLWLHQIWKTCFHISIQ